jgi:mediator of RNA polymerase II transcription subunit 16, fungi type
VHGPAVRDGNAYKYESSYIPAVPPWHPNMAKSSFMAVSTNGLLRLLYVQNSSSQIEEVSMELEAVTSSDDLVTHAGLSSDKSRSQGVYQLCHPCLKA